MLLTETVLLGSLGGSLSVAILFWGRGAVKFSMPKALGPTIHIDWRVLVFTAGCALTVGLLFGLIPALMVSRVELNSGLRENATRFNRWAPVLLSAGQIALSLMLLAGAGLMIRSFLVLASVNPGFDPRNILMATAMLRPVEVYGPERQAEFYNRILTGLEKLPGVRHAAVTSSPPMAQFGAITTGLRPDNGPEINETVSESSVSANYFQV